MPPPRTQHTTLTSTEEPTREGAGPPRLYLSLAFQVARPDDPARRYSLDDLDEVRLGRGEAYSATRTGRSLDLRLPEPSLSGAHLSLRRAGPNFLALDEGSKNGSRRNGVPLDKALLGDGDVLEVGRTFWVYRSERPDSVADTDPQAHERAASPSVGGDATVTLHPGFERDLARLAAVAPTRLPVQVHGETGAGKERIVREVHRLSRRSGRLVTVNCGALPEALVEAELYGSRRGAYTGAVEDRVGLIRHADKGTLFLDEIGDLPMAAQVKLLRALQEGEVTPVGGQESVRVDVRVVTATHRDLAGLVAAGRFREDLAARLAGLSITVPPLRERREDLGLIAGSCLARIGTGGVPARLAQDAARVLFLHSFPMNVRELERALELSVTLAGRGPIQAAHLPSTLREAVSAPVAATTVSREPLPLTPEEELRRGALLAALVEHRGNIAAVARQFGKGREQIHRWLRRFEIDLDSYRG